jgi:hypothetical protein
MPTKNTMKFKLKDQAEVQASAGVQFHARALRAIGQDLSKLFPQSLEITLQGVNFEVVGRYIPRDGGEKGGQQDNHLLGKLRSKFLRDPSSSSTTVDSVAGPVGFSRTYTPADIEAIDEAGANHRNGPAAAPDIYSLGETLRMVGRMVDASGGRLCKLSRDTYGVRFEHEDGAGEVQKSELSSLQLYKLQQQYYAERGTYVPIDNWKSSI